MLNIQTLSLSSNVNTDNTIFSKETLSCNPEKESWQMYSVKGQAADILGFAGRSLGHNHSVLLLWQDGSHRQ